MQSLFAIVGETLKAPIEGWSKNLVWKCSLSAIAGSIISLFMATMVTIVLVEITIHKLFATVFGIMFLVFGIILICRVYSMPVQDEDSIKRKNIFLSLTSMIVISGALCICLDKKWLVSFYAWARILLYTYISTSMAFTIIFCFLDLLVVVVEYFQINHNRNLIRNDAQAKIMLYLATIMGCIFGWKFGRLGNSNIKLYAVSIAMLKRQSDTFVIAAILGAWAGYTNEYICSQEDGYIRMKREEFDNAI